MLYIPAIFVFGLMGLFIWAGDHAHRGNYWADRLCTSARQLCEAPQWLLIVAGGLILLALFREAMRA